MRKRTIKTKRMKSMRKETLSKEQKEIKSKENKEANTKNVDNEKNYGANDVRDLIKIRINQRRK